MGPFAALELVNTVGDVAGIGALAAVGLLALLTISQARDVRRLREWAGRAPERAAAAEQALLAYETGDQQVLEYEPEYEAEGQAEAPDGAPAEGAEGPAASPPPIAPPAPPRESWQIEAEAAAAAEVMQRREERERTLYTTEGQGPFGEHSVLVVVLGAAILLFALVFGAFQVLGGGGGAEEAGDVATKAPRKRDGATSPGQVRVAVLNGTAVPGLAARVGDDVRSGGFKLGAVTNSESSFETTVVMYARGHEPEASAVAKQIGVVDVRLMTPEIQRVAKGAEVAVVVGDDRAPTTSTGTVTPTTTTPAAPTPTPTPVTP